MGIFFTENVLEEICYSGEMGGKMNVCKKKVYTYAPVLQKRKCLSAIRIVSAIAAAYASVFSQAVDISGRVVNESGQPLQNVGVLLVGREMTTVTDGQGHYAFSSNASVGSKSALTVSALPALNRGLLHFSVIGSGRQVVITVFNLGGKRLAQTDLGRLSDGNYTWNAGSIFSRSPSGLIVLHVRIGSDCVVFKIAGINREFSNSTILSRSDRPATAKNAVASPVDSLFFWISGYENAKYSLTTLSTVVPDVVLRAGIAFEPYYFGNGTIIDLRDSQAVHLPIARRIQVVVFGEGYTAADLAANRYETDLNRWMTEVFKLRVAAYYKEAYVVWKYRSPSKQHLVSTGQVDSYFKLPLSGGAMAASPYDSAAAIMWQALQRFPFLTGDYSYGSGARNLVCSFMLYDSARARSGFSGMTRTLSNPAAASQRIWVAMALDQHHEFMHAMARLADEYHDAAFTPLPATSATQTSQRITNVIFSAKGDSLPWKHLLKGIAINPGTDSLIGAFGTNGRFHPELKCLMNGSHDNAAIFGGNGNLRPQDRMCNWCEELLAFRTYERTMVLPDQNTSWDLWVTNYRAGFYRSFGFYVPATVPQTNSAGVAYFMPCVQ